MGALGVVWYIGPEFRSTSPLTSGASYYGPFLHSAGIAPYDRPRDCPTAIAGIALSLVLKSLHLPRASALMADPDGRAVSTLLEASIVGLCVRLLARAPTFITDCHKRMLLRFEKSATSGLTTHLTGARIAGLSCARLAPYRIYPTNLGELPRMRRQSKLYAIFIRRCDILPSKFCFEARRYAR
jgi:hypothetical protein